MRECALNLYLYRKRRDTNSIYYIIIIIRVTVKPTIHSLTNLDITTLGFVIFTVFES